MEKKVEDSLMELLFNEHINFDEIYVDDYAARILTDENCVAIVTKKLVETEN